MRTSAGVEDLYRQAAAATAEGSKSFYFATRFFPPDLARAAHAIYWFCRYTDDIVDECESQERGRADLEDWAEQVQRAFHGGRPTHPVLQVFQDTASTYRIPAEYPLELIEGMRMDLNGTRYRTFTELRVFCYRVASIVGLMMSEVIGVEEAGLPHAIDLGIAMQLTNILRDIGEDLDRGRIYLPSEEMEDCGYTERELRARVQNGAFRELMRRQVARARHYYEQAAPGIPMLHPRGRFAVKIAADVYREILGRMELAGFAVFDCRAFVPARRKYWITARCMAGPFARYSMGKLPFWRS